VSSCITTVDKLRGNSKVERANRMEEILSTLTSEFGKLRARFRIVSINHLRDLRKEIEERRHNGNISGRFYAEQLGFLRFEQPDVPPSAKSIIVIAIPQRITLVEFRPGGKGCRVIIPPTYVYTEVRETCRSILSRVLQGTDSKIARVSLPLKLLAVRSGLGKYGRNNICYVEGMGSFHRLEAFYTDYPFSVDNWQKKEMLDSCADCSICLQVCPTQCISTERFLIDAERCLTRFNEMEGDFPGWIDPKSHNALVGCMRCQITCPPNREFVRGEERGEALSEEETEMILKGIPEDSLPVELAAKLKQLNMDEYYPLLPRNLAVLMKR
jgi:epoxyqueuosine reductase